MDLIKNLVLYIKAIIAFVKSILATLGVELGSVELPF